VSPEAQREALAAAFPVSITAYYGGHYCYWTASAYESGIRQVDPLNDLNCIWVLEIQLTDIQRRMYLDHLDEIVPHGNGISEEGMVAHTAELFNFLHATALQRAEAILKAIGKWEASP